MTKKTDPESILETFFNKNKGKIKCNLCGKNKFQIAGKYKIASGDEDDNEGMHMPILIVSCVNCTNLMIFPTLVMEKTLDSKLLDN